MDAEQSPLFPQFALLPAELRLRIWSFAAPRRTIPVRLKQDLDAWNWASNLDWWMHYNVVPDGQGPSVIPAVLLVNTEARREAIKQYRQPLRIERDHVKRGIRRSREPELDQNLDQQSSKSFDKMCDASSVKPFHEFCDVLEWAETWRWHRDAMTNTTPLFLGACLSVRHVSIEYALWMFGHLETLAKAAMSKRHPTSLQTITVTINQPRERRQTQYRLAKRPRASQPYPRTSVNTDLGKDTVEEAEAAIAKAGAVTFDPGATEPQNEFALFQVTRPADLNDREVASACLNQLRSESERLFDVAYRLYTESSSGHDDTIPGRLLSDVAEWCEKLNLQAVDPFSRGLSVDFTIPSHGTCSPEYGLPGVAAEAWMSRCLRQTDWDKVWDRRGAPSASSM
ncbi:uncharacterized protein B0I36DRAFT_328954 [Microdochium trichocladiopsis]|uniref:2EXR domain-containing protein n=1 Tax=Microdochium trichocladiopsis TaxID=1682393 RepID=A0A9P9BLX9_9PEZI|nr:uncharacterized protein B0I36DRAFT_328954 [Microdochium trichocladiopsis]KAH7025708.1 hypothetical protein B0I36DRAFT_328954 [Microdochium trichocladiopsis]